MPSHFQWAYLVMYLPKRCLEKTWKITHFPVIENIWKIWKITKYPPKINLSWKITTD